MVAAGRRLPKMNRSEDRVRVHRDARGVVSLTLNRPDRNNAYDGVLLAAAHQALDQLQAVPGSTRARPPVRCPLTKLLKAG